MTTLLLAALGSHSLLLVATNDAAAQAVYLGPTPYPSLADSPFDTAAFGFCVEDFEAGPRQIPGARMSQDGELRRADTQPRRTCIESIRDHT